MTQRILIVAVALLLGAAIFADSVLQAHLNCARGNGSREGLLLFFQGAEHRSAIRFQLDHGEVRTLDLDAESAARRAAAVELPRRCHGLFP